MIRLRLALPVLIALCAPLCLPAQSASSTQTVLFVGPAIAHSPAGSHSELQAGFAFDAAPPRAKTALL
ncbi:MAG: hypothetical protein ACRD1F_12575 [Terriglobales bacterium]